jgi:ribonucleotide reductase beta subunit family protein with ferritin-like domain
MANSHAKRAFDPITDKEENNADRFVVGDVVNQDAYLFYKKALASFWVSEAIDLASDSVGFERLSSDERAFLLMVLAFFAGSDGVVLENLVCRFYNEVQQAEVRLFYGLQIAVENIHSETYTELIRAYERDADARARLFRAIDDMPAVKAKADWALRWLSSDASFARRLIAFAAVEGILFSSSFCAIFYLRKRSLQLPGLFQSNDYIARDEALHTQFACLLHSQLQPHNQCSQAEILEIIRSAVEVEEVFVRAALARPILGMNAESMILYVRYVADVLLLMLGCPRFYNVENPFPFMETISLSSKANFFERRVTDYALAHVDVNAKVPQLRARSASAPDAGAATTSAAAFASTPGAFATTEDF